MNNSQRMYTMYRCFCLEDALKYLASCAFVFSPDSRVLVASTSGEIHLLDRRSSASQESHDGHEQPLTETFISPDGQFVASASRDKTVCLWDTSTGSRLKTLKCKASFVTFSSDSQSLACYGFDSEGDPIHTVWDWM